MNWCDLYGAPTLQATTVQVPQAPLLPLLEHSVVILVVLVEILERAVFGGGSRLRMSPDQDQVILRYTLCPGHYCSGWQSGQGRPGSRSLSSFLSGGRGQEDQEDQGHL